MNVSKTICSKLHSFTHWLIFLRLSNNCQIYWIVIFIFLDRLSLLFTLWNGLHGKFEWFAIVSRRNFINHDVQVDERGIWCGCASSLYGECVDNTEDGAAWELSLRGVLGYGHGQVLFIPDRLIVIEQRENKWLEPCSQ